jgi:hypothetical protein
MSVSNRLVYDPANPSVGASVGSYLLAGTDGTQIGHVSDALKVNFTNSSLAVTATDLDIRDLAFASDSVTAHQGGSWTVGVSGTVAVTQSTSPWVIGDGGGSITVDAVDLDIRDLSAASDSVSSWTKDGAGNAINSTSNALNVYVAGGFTDVDDSLANSAIFTEKRQVSTTAIAVTAAAALTDRKWLYIANEGTKVMYIGPSGVTTASGFPMYKGERMELRCGAANNPYIIGEAGASNEDIRVMQLS